MGLFSRKTASADVFAALLIAVAFCLGICFWNYYPAGYFHDDAIYWLLSQAVRQGRYVLLSDPAQPVFINYMPGYPFLLAAVGWVGGFAVGKALSLLLTAASGALAWLILRRWEKSPAVLLTLAWFVFQPFLIRNAAVVLAEPLFLVLVLFCFLSVDRPGSVREDSLLALAAGYACLVRPAGFLLGGALFLDALLRGNLRRGGILAAGLALFQGGFSLVSAGLGHGASSFLGQWKLALAGAPSGTLLSLVRDNLAYYVDYISWMVLFPLGRWAALVKSVPGLAILLNIFLWGILVKGAIAMIRKRQFAWPLFFVLQAVLLAFWLRPDPRYVQPLIFPALVLFLSGISFPGLAGDRIKQGAAAMGIFLCLASNVRGVADNVPDRRPRLPEETLTWVRSQLPVDAVIAGEMASTVYLQTGRRGTNFLRSYDPEDFLEHWVERGVSYVLVERGNGFAAARPDANDWNFVTRLMLTQLGRYAKIMSFESDGLDLYEIREDTGAFRRGYVFYRKGMAAAEAGDWPGARDSFQSAVRESPGMSGAYDRLAEASIHLNDETLARGSLKEGLARWPSSPLLHYHSYMVLRRHSAPAAKEELAAARDIARRYGYWPLLWQIDRIQQ